MRELGATTLSLAVSCLAVAVALGAQPRVIRVVARETSLGARLPGVVERTLSISATQRLAYVVQLPKSAGEAVVVDGVQGRAYTFIPRVPLTEAGITPPIVFSPDGKRIAYVASQDDRWRVVVDGVDGTAYDRIDVGAPTFSPDSRHLAYFAERAGKQLIVIDGVEGPAYDSIDQDIPAFAADSRRWGYAARRDSLRYLIVDGKELGGAEYVGDPVFSDSTGRFAYVVKRHDTWAVVVDGVEGKAYRSIGNNLVFSADGRHFLYRGGDKEDHVVVDGVESAGFGSIKENSYAFSPDGSHVAFVTTAYGEDAWVVDGKKGKAYDWVSTQPTFSPDGQHLTYVAERDRKRFVVIDAWEGATFDDITEFPTFSANGRVLYVGKRGAQQFVGIDSRTIPFDQVSQVFTTTAGRLVIAARRGTRWRPVVDGVEGPSYERPVGPFATSPDGKRIAYMARRGGRSVVATDGVEGRLYDQAGDLQFSPDSRHVIYTAKRPNGWVVVVDNVESAAYDEILSFPRPTQIEAGALTMLARRGQIDLSVRIAWK